MLRRKESVRRRSCEVGVGGGEVVRWEWEEVKL